MQKIKKRREKAGFSQRDLAKKAQVSFRTLQLVEKKGHDARLSTFSHLASALGYPKNVFSQYVNRFFSYPPFSLFMISQKIAFSRTKEWQVYFFNFVDEFRKTKDSTYINKAPDSRLSQKLTALFASASETLCDELNLKHPDWCAGVASLKTPFFVSQIENLKPLALIETPIHFKKRNVFVLNNFLDRY